MIRCEWNMPDGATSAQYDAYMGYDQPGDDEDDWPEVPELPVVTAVQPVVDQGAYAWITDDDVPF